MNKISSIFNNSSHGKKTTTIIILSKIFIFILISIWFIGNFSPYYSGADSKLYGVSAIDLANGEYGYSNELLSETGKWEFISKGHLKTIHNTAIPAGSFGIYGLSVIAYFIGGIYGLFYLGPVMAIILIIATERIATKLFGKGAGLVALVIIFSDLAIQKLGLQLLVDISFSLFFILGCYFLIKFLQRKKALYILLCSSLFSIATFFRLSGLILFPVEIFIIVGYFIIYKNIFKINILNGKNSLHNIKRLRVSSHSIKITLLMMIPWIVFLIYFFSFNSYYFGDPLTTYGDAAPIIETDRGTRSSFFYFDLERLEWFTFYLTGFIPDEIKNKLQYISSEDHSWNSELNWMGVISFVIIAAGLFVSLKKKIKRTAIIILFLFALSFPFFHSASYLHHNNYLDSNPTFGSNERYMLPSFLALALILSFIIREIWTGYLNKHSDKSTKKILFLRALFIVLVFTFLISSVYDSKMVNNLEKSGLIIRDPDKFTERYPIDQEGISEKSILMGSRLRRAFEYDVTMFNPFWVNTNSERTDENTPQETIQLLKESMNKGYSVYTFKDNRPGEENYLKYLIVSHGFVSKIHSKTFCELILIDNYSKFNNITNIESDEICVKSGLK